MFQGKEKRKDPRLDARIKVKFRTGSEFATCYSKNISRGGIFIETEELPDPNATVELVLDLTDPLKSEEPTELAIHGRVVRLMTVTENSRSIHQVAIQFIDLPPKVQIQLDKYYEQLLHEES